MLGFNNATRPWVLWFIERLFVTTFCGQLKKKVSSQDEIAKVYVEPKIREITLELLNIIRQTENDDLTSVMQKIVCTYTEQLIPVAVDMCKHLVETFAQVS